MAHLPCEKVLLPASIEDLTSKYFPDLSIFNTLKLSCGYDPSKLTPAQKIVWKYSGGALIAGRPLDSAIIFMAGVSGAGKSSTINALFEDHDLCKTSSARSETEHVALIRKQLCVSAETPAVQGYLSFVDVPGTFDTDSTKEAQNTAIIRKFRKTAPELAERKNTTLQMASVRKTVYPNILLFFINATDERMDGKDSQLARSLQAFKITADLIDEDRNNVIVVLTHVLSLGINKKKFNTKLEQRTKIIKEQFRRILNIKNVEVVPVENKPEEFRDSDSDDGNDQKKNEFYKLPNGEFSHHNLFEAILRRVDENSDLLGRLLVSHYFSDACPEKTEKAQVKIFDKESTEIEIAEAATELSSLQIGIVTNTQPVIPFHNFQSMLRGYCPVTEDVKTSRSIIQQPENMKVVNIGSSKFAVPNYIEVFSNRETRFQKLTFYDKQDYQDHMKQEYGLDAGVKFVVKTSSEGKWVNTGSGSRESSMLSVVQEIQMAEFKLTNVDAIQLEPKFETQLKNLPNNYSEETKAKFRQFFERWGTHLICEQAVGGAIQLDCTVDQASLTREQFQNVNVEVSGFFKDLFAGETDYNNSSDRKKLSKFGITNEHLRITGGDPPKFVNLETINPQVLQGWAETVENSPSQLRCSAKLLPYSNFATEEQASALRQATQDYLANNLTLNTVTVTNGLPDRNAISDAGTAGAVKNKGEGCFPKGALVSLANGEKLEIEKLGQSKTALKTTSLQRTWFDILNKLKVGKSGSARFCTYLDKVDDQYLEYLALEFDNGKTLTATEDHLIFQCVSDKGNIVVSKRVKYFQVGDQALYFNSNENKFETRTVTKIFRKLSFGAYCPLTTTGTLIVDGFLVSSYSSTDSFSTAQAAMLPLKLYCQARNALQCTPVDDLSPKGKVTGIHPYGQFLISLRKKFGSVLKKKDVLV